MRPISSEHFCNITALSSIFYFNSMMEDPPRPLLAQQNAIGNEDTICTVNAREHELVDLQILVSAEGGGPGLRRWLPRP